MDLDLLHDVGLEGAWVFFAVLAVILVGSMGKLVGGSRWEDWLDERWGRGSVRDHWWLRRMERDADRHPPR